MTVLVSLTPEHVQAVKEARLLLARMAAQLPDYGDVADLLTDQLGDILNLARAEERHSIGVDYRRIAEEGARLMSGPDSGGYPLGSPKLHVLREEGKATY